MKQIVYLYCMEMGEWMNRGLRIRLKMDPQQHC